MKYNNTYIPMLFESLNQWVVPQVRLYFNYEYQFFVEILPNGHGRIRP